MKKKVLIGLSVVALVALMAVGAWAWFTDAADPVSNVFTAGTVKIALHDEFAADGITDWNPGDTTSKEVSVENTGSLDVFVRVKLTPEWDGADLGAENVILNLNDDANWVEEGDYYYYLLALKAGDETPLLLESVTLDGASTDNDYQGATLTITVEAEAIQSEHVLGDDDVSAANLAALDWK